MKVKILGTTYEVVVKKYADDPEFDRRGICGYQDSVMKRVVVCDMRTWPTWENEEFERCQAAQRETLRHEIVHAFFSESGLEDSSLQYSAGWAKNEEMVDWIALQGPKIYEAWRKAGAL